MIATARPLSALNRTTSAHDQFISMLPQIKLQAHVAFRHRLPEEREDLVQEVIANAFAAFTRLVKLGKQELAYPSPLAQYAIRQIRSGRRVGSRISTCDVMSPANRRVRVERLDQYESNGTTWKEVVVEDRRATPADTAAARLDLAQWFRSLPRRNRRVAQVLAAGETTKQAAKQFGISSARVSQLRQELRRSWLVMQGEWAAA